MQLYLQFVCSMWYLITYLLQVGQNNYTEFWSLNFMEHLKLPLIFKNWATKVASAEKREFQISGLKHEDESFKRWIVNLTTCIFM